MSIPTAQRLRSEAKKIKLSPYLRCIIHIITPIVKNNIMDFNKGVLEKSHDLPVIVDFWASWCGPCRILGPTIEQLAEEQKDKWSLVKIDTEEEYELAAQYRVQSIPNVKMFYKERCNRCFP